MSKRPLIMGSGGCENDLTDSEYAAGLLETLPEVEKVLETSRFHIWSDSSSLLYLYSSLYVLKGTLISAWRSGGQSYYLTLEAESKSVINSIWFRFPKKSCLYTLRNIHLYAFSCLLKASYRALQNNVSPSQLENGIWELFKKKSRFLIIIHR